MHRLLLTLGALAITNLTGCLNVVTVRADGSTVRHHLGYVQVVTPKHVTTGAGVTVLEVNTYGLRLHDGFGAGYFHERNEFIPLDTRLVLRVADAEQLAQASRLLTPLLKEPLCLIVDTTK